MIDAGRGSRLTPKPLAFLSIAGVRAQALDCDRTIETIVVRGVDDSHAAFAKLAHDAIPAGLALLAIAATSTNISRTIVCRNDVMRTSVLS